MRGNFGEMQGVFTTLKNTMKMMIQIPLVWRAGFLGLALLGVPVVRAAEIIAEQTVVPKWQAYEKTLTSTATYTNPWQQAELTVTLTSPGGVMKQIYGFWDGGKTWRFRFAPDAGGQWEFTTSCSDPANTGLHGQKGTFLCGPPQGATRFQEHGPVQVATTGRSLAHADGTPFFWLADAPAGDGTEIAEADWAALVDKRAAEKFTAVQFSAGSKAGASRIYSGREQITIHPAEFAKLDAKILRLEKAGLLSAPILLEGEIKGVNSLPSAQVVKLARYMVARWQASPCFWILSSGGHYFGGEGNHWKQIGRAVFGSQTPAPVALIPPPRHWIASEFSGERWMNVVGYASGSNLDPEALRWLQEGPVAKDWNQPPPARPFLNLRSAPLSGQSLSPGATNRANEIRRSLYWSLLNAPTVGVSSSDPGSLVAAEAKVMTEFFTGIDFAHLRPMPFAVVNNPGVQNPLKFIALARSEKKDVLVAYVPEERTVEILLESFPPSPDVKWINPRTGEKSPAVGVVTERSCQFPTPGEGDWILLLRSQAKIAPANVK